jgi:hypothetical protein
MFILWFLGGVSLCIPLALCCFVHVVPSKRQRILLNNMMGTKRIISGGFQLIPPWESTVQAQLPYKNGISYFQDFAPGAVFRYDPPPYEVLSKDQVTVFIDLWIEYTIHDLAALAEAPEGNYHAMLDDEVRAEASAVAADYTRTELRGDTLKKRFAEHTWTKHPALQITHVGMQNFKFDAATQTLLRGISMGLQPIQAAQHAQQMALNRSVATNPGAQVLMTGDAASGVMMGGARGQPAFAVKTKKKSRRGRDSEDESS